MLMTSLRATATDAQLKKVFEAYRSGLRGRPRAGISLPSRDFSSLVFQGTIGWLSLRERLDLRCINKACGEGLSASRQGRVDDAGRLFEQAEERLRSLEPHAGPAWLIGVSAYQAGVAYLDFKSGRIEQVLWRLDRAMDADLELERKGFSVIQMHRVQQGHNLARIDLRLGRREGALRMAGTLLAYLERQIPRLPYHREWHPEALLSVPTRLVQTMIHQILGEAAGYIVTGTMPREEWSSLIGTARLRAESERAMSPQAQYALQAQLGLLLGDARRYLGNLERFFSFGINACRPLWYAAMVELSRFCKELDTDYSRQVQAMILRDSTKWRGLPGFLRDRLR
ncbi:MAG: hypothetical protein ABUT39_02895 [Acidobacteriota bacterium]